MNPCNGPFKYRSRSWSIVDGCSPPEKHMGHEVIRVLEHVPK